VHPPWWKTWWAYSIYAAIFCLVLIGFVRYQAKKLASHELFQKQINEKVASETEIYFQVQKELNEKIVSLNKIALFDLETKLPGPLLFIEKMSVVRDILVKHCSSCKNRDLIMTVSLVEIGVSNDADAKEQLCDSARLLSDYFNEVALWDVNRLALTTINMKANDAIKTGSKTIATLFELGKKLQSRQFNSCSIQLSVDDITQLPDIESIMVIIEHLINLATKEGLQSFNLYVDRVYRPLTGLTIKQILSKTTLDDIEPFLKVSGT
jgi:hypothetical protein